MKGGKGVNQGWERLKAEVSIRAAVVRLDTSPPGQMKIRGLE